MKTTLRARRIMLDEEAVRHLTQMLVTLSNEGRHVSRTPSKAVSWIISDFAVRHFRKDKHRMKAALLNRVSFLRSVVWELKDGSDEEIRGLRAVLDSLGRKRLGKPTPAVRRQKLCPLGKSIIWDLAKKPGKRNRK